MDDQPAEDPRAQKPGVCGVTTTDLAIERICILPVHDDGPNTASRRARPGSTPKADRHWFVRRFPEGNH